jgi:hypothetical protein
MDNHFLKILKLLSLMDLAGKKNFSKINRKKQSEMRILNDYLA